MRISDPTAYAEWNTKEHRESKMLPKARTWADLMEHKLTELTETIALDIEDGLRSGPPGMALRHFFDMHAFSMLDRVHDQVGRKVSHTETEEIVGFLARSWVFGPDLWAWWIGNDEQEAH